MIWPPCMCGCLTPAPLAAKTNSAKGLVCGQPTRFVRGHYCRAGRTRKPPPAPEVVERRREARRASWRAYHERNPERQRGRVRERDPMQVTAWAAARRAREREAFVEQVNPLVVLELHDGVCGICGEDVDPLDFHVDHIVPLAKGGEHSYANSQPSHPPCNLRKGARLVV